MFPIGFRVEVDPEFAGDGGVPPERIPAELPAIGAVLRITPQTGEPWDIAIGAPSWWRTPVATQIAFVSDFTGYVVDVVERRIVHRVAAVSRVTEDERHDMVLMLGDEDMTAIGADGIRWTSERLALGDLKVRRIDDRGIHCTGYLVPGDTWRGIPAQFVVDPRNGVLLRVE